MALERDFLTIIKDLDRRLTNLERHPQAPAIALSNVAGVTPFAIANATSGLVSFTVANVNNLRLLPLAFLSLFKNTTAIVANKYPTGANWSSADIAGVRFEHWLELDATDGNNGVVYLHIVNNTGAALTVYPVSQWRVLQSNGGIA